MQFDKDYYDALNHTFDLECEKLNKTELNKIIPSEQFTKKMERMIHRRRRPYFKLFATGARRAACIIVIVLVLGTISVTQVDAFRIPLCKFLIDSFSKTISVDNSSETPEVINCYYEITEFPEDFVPELQSSTLFMESTFFHYANRNDPKESLLFGQCLLKDYKDVEYSGEPENYTDSDGKEYLLLYTANGVTAVWNNGEYAFFLISDREKEDVLTVCRSLRIKKFS